MRCKYIYKNGFYEGEQCEIEAEPGSDYCFWHEKKDGKDISSKKINEKNLQEAYLVRAHLENTEFKEHTNLSFAELNEADLSNANLKMSIIWQANLEGATLADTNFEGSFSSYELHDDFYLSIANLQGRELKTANFKRAFSPNVNFRRSNLNGIDFKGARLEGANFSECYLKYADFVGSYLAGVKFQGVDLEGADLRGAFLHNLSLDGIRNLQNAQFSCAIEEIIGDIIIKLGTLKQGKEEEYWQKFSDEIIRLFQLRGETKENSEVISEHTIPAIKEAFELTFLDLADNRVLVLSSSGKLYTMAKDIYLNLKNFFRDNGLYEKSGEFYIWEQITRGKIQKVSYLLDYELIRYRIKFLFKKVVTLIRRDKIQTNDDNQIGTKVINLESYTYTEHIFSVSLARDIKSFFHNFLSWLGNAILRTTSLYGESPLRVLLTSIWIIIFYALIYTVFCGVTISGNLHILKNILDYIYFSIETFLTLSYGELQPTPSMRLVAGSEAFLGAFIIAYFVVVVSRKIMR